MAVAAVKTWIREILFASDLNAEFSNVYDNGEDVVSPSTKPHDMDGFELILDADADSSLTADTDDRLDIRLQGVDLFRYDATVATAVNGMDFTASATGVTPTIQTVGADTNVHIDLLPKGVTKDVLLNGDSYGVLASQVFGD